jgi:hypothetical protein
VILLELLAGAPLASREGLSGLAAPLYAPVPMLLRHRPEVEEALASTVARALHRDPRRRHATASELGRALMEFAAPSPEARRQLAALVAG